MRRLALIDGDIILWKAASAAQENVDFGDGEIVSDADPEKAFMLVRRMIAAIKNRTESQAVLVCLSPDKGGERHYPRYWRHDILPSYKEHRPEKEAKQPPLLLRGDVREFIEKNYPVRCEDGLEADDLLGIFATDPTDVRQTVICSIDKDFLQIPGLFYNTQDGTIEDITEDNADRAHFYQMLIGDTVDNYKGCPGIGPKKAGDILVQAGLDAMEEGAPSPNRCRWRRVVEAFKQPRKNKPKLTINDALVQARVSRILRWDEYDPYTRKVMLWEPPHE